MENSCHFQVIDWMAVSPVRANRASWLAWARGKTEQNLQEHDNYINPIPPSLRRRLRSAGLLAAQAVYGLGDIPANIKFIFCSRHGEFRRNLSLLNQLAKGEELSPADFSLSVHNAIAGLLSISSNNKAGHVAIAAGHDTFCAGLLEAIGAVYQVPDQPVLFVYYDEPLPEPYSYFHMPWETSLGIALLIRAAKFEPGAIEFSWSPETHNHVEELQALTFLRFFLQPMVTAKAPGIRKLWSWSYVT